MDNIIKWLKKHLIKLIFILVFIIILIVLIPISFYIENPWGYGFIPKNEAGNVLSYYGAILGGGLTFVGVLLTINFEKRDNKESLAIQYKPILAFDRDAVIDTKNYIIKVKYQNCGRGEALNIKVKIIDGPPNHIKINDADDKINLLPYNESNFFILNLDKKIIDSNDKTPLNYIIELSYNDLFDIYLTRTQAILTIKYNIDESKYYATLYENSIKSEKK